jgi:hypothetical protein
MALCHTCRHDWPEPMRLDLCDCSRQFELLLLKLQQLLKMVLTGCTTQIDHVQFTSIYLISSSVFNLILSIRSELCAKAFVVLIYPNDNILYWCDGKSECLSLGTLHPSWFLTACCSNCLTLAKCPCHSPGSGVYEVCPVVLLGSAVWDLWCWFNIEGFYFIFLMCVNFEGDDVYERYSMPKYTKSSCTALIF